MSTPAAVQAAAECLAGVAHHTPVLTSRTLDARLGASVFFKCENFQRMGAFKFRGAYFAISRLSESERAAGVITHSSGNHAQGLALAARLLGVRAVVVMPADAPPNKRAATEGYGAEVVPCDALYREEVTAQLIADHGYTLVHPFDNDNIIAGQGTAALELFDEVGPLDYLFVPVGGGGLISGSALAAQLRAPECRVVGVEPALGADANRSWRSGEVYKLEAVPATIADGLRTRAIGGRNLAIMRRYVSDMTTATEEEILAALEFIWARLKIVVEPSSAVALAPLLAGAYSVPPGARVGVLLSGGNVNVAALLQPPVAAPAPAAAAAREGSTAPGPRSASRILTCVPLQGQAMAMLTAAGQVDSLPDANEETLTSRIGDYHALIVGPDQRINNHVLKYGYNLRAIGTLSDRLSNIDVSAARALGIEVCYAPDSRAVAIAEHTVARLLALAENLGDGRLAGKTLGLIGFGLVGKLVAQRAAAFDMRILTNQPRLTPELALAPGVVATDLIDLLGQADFISLHVPFSEETEAIIGARELAAVKPAAMLVNMGHTDLIDDEALLHALDSGAIAGAALSDLPASVTAPSTASLAVRRHPRVRVSPHVSAVLDDQRRDAALQMARQVVAALQVRRANETLNLEIVPIELVAPHEHIDQKRVTRLMERLEVDGRLVNPPVTTYWKGRYVILDGATRYSALQRLGYRFAIVQVVDETQTGFQLHTWYHAISAEPETPESFAPLEERLRAIPGLQLRPLAPENARQALEQPQALCYFLTRDGELLLAELAEGAPRLAVMNALVDTYNAWGNVERTLLTDTERLLAQFPHLVAVAIFPQFAPAEVFDAAAEGDLLPAGLTRFVIPGRILRLNADLERLKCDEPPAEKRAWFNEFLGGKLSRSRLRYYQEPVVLLDE
ncbi:MAG: pyridoxal-phosphate dependent enzyme [Candidatus Promineofilum sp.]|nr:pyridoxal-phosphate dependent enzyme [Promineifilum sp.]MCW5863010.1 pyridoxal-phosphate dependent enzyme [Anaerolineae bacterium]